jgi:hypothetical protein
LHDAAVDQACERAGAPLASTNAVCDCVSDAIVAAVATPLQDVARQQHFGVGVGAADDGCNVSVAQRIEQAADDLDVVLRHLLQYPARLVDRTVRGPRQEAR